jgi:hypothetical protein
MANADQNGVHLVTQTDRNKYICYPKMGRIVGDVLRDVKACRPHGKGLI